MAAKKGKKKPAHGTLSSKGGALAKVGAAGMAGKKNRRKRRKNPSFDFMQSVFDVVAVIASIFVYTPAANLFDKLAEKLKASPKMRGGIKLLGAGGILLAGKFVEVKGWLPKQVPVFAFAASIAGASAADGVGDIRSASAEGAAAPAQAQGRRRRAHGGLAYNEGAAPRALGYEQTAGTLSPGSVPGYGENVRQFAGGRGNGR